MFMAFEKPNFFKFSYNLNIIFTELENNVSRMRMYQTVKKLKEVLNTVGMSSNLIKNTDDGLNWSIFLSSY